MNRNEELMDMIKELDEAVPEMGGAIAKASRRKARKNFLYQPLAGITCLFAAFVLSVNLCAPIAEACSKIPVLRDLVKAVTFSKSSLNSTAARRMDAGHSDGSWILANSYSLNCSLPQVILRGTGIRLSIFSPRIS